MTKTNEQKFEKRLKIKKEEWSSEFSESSSIPYHERCAYDEGARWAYQQAISDVLEKLRDLDRFEHGGKDCLFWADWLEKEMRGGRE